MSDARIGEVIDLTRPVYWCVGCSQRIEGDDIDDRHSTEAGDDCHARCCPICNAATDSSTDPLSGVEGSETVTS